MTDTTVTLGLPAIVVMLWLIYSKLRDIHRELIRNESTLTNIHLAQINPRTRLGGPVAVQSGEVSHEQKLQRLGRHSSGRRIVVGGDDDSQLTTDLTTSIREADHG